MATLPTKNIKDCKRVSLKRNLSPEKPGVSSLSEISLSFELEWINFSHLIGKIVGKNHSIVIVNIVCNRRKSLSDSNYSI